MIFRRRTRRIIGAVLIVLGAALMLLAPETVGGVALFALAVLLEFVGLVLERRDGRSS